MTKTKCYFIDADVLVYRALTVCEEEERTDDELISLTINMREAIGILKSMVKRIAGDTPVLMCLSCATTEGFRRKLLPTYKENRVSHRKPLGLQTMRTFIRNNYETVEMPTLEADDVLGILQTDPDSKYVGIIWTVDKDLKTIPGLIELDEDDVIFITEEQADTMFYTQCLTGDTVDNYKGVPGIGPAKAKKILSGKSTDNMWDKVVRTYKSAGLTEQDALVQARMARILRYEDWDSEKQEVILWNYEDNTYSNLSDPNSNKGPHANEEK